ncbi:MAG: hypothetical protein PHX30_06045 [Candidatus Pacebacteria bacterium]|nr:hypothetical protein [Candidatus Paceibacterota bacterium]
MEKGMLFLILMNNMVVKKINKGFWERFFIYPSFNIRFWFTAIIALFLIVGISFYLIFVRKICQNISDQISLLNLIVQSVTFVFGILAAYYALRQLIETRFTKLDEAAMQELKRNHYLRAFEKWREAFYIRPETEVFMCMCEALLLAGDFENFDQYIEKAWKTDPLYKNIIREESDEVLLLYLIATRYLLVKNQGKAENEIKKIVVVVKEKGLLGFSWDFMDLRGSPVYQDLNGECRDIAENLVSYLSKNMPMQPKRKIDFEKGLFASQKSE